MLSTRDRLLHEGMRLFGEQGYASTSVAQIEAASGLSPGSGSLYKHFRSKEALLSAGLERLLGSGTRVAQPLAPAGSEELPGQLEAVARAGLRRMQEDRDLSRLLFRGLDAFPELLRRFGDQEIARLHRATASMLAESAGQAGVGVDWSAVAAVLQGATAHYWVLRDLFGEHPTGVDEDGFVAALAALALALLTSPAPATPGRTQSHHDESQETP